MSDALQTYVTRFLRDRERLQRTLPEALLLFEPPDEASVVPRPEQEEYVVRTQTSVNQLLHQPTGPTVFVVEKSHRNAFGRGITVGRAANNDVVMDDGSVSRFHAWFEKDAETGLYQVADAGSKNGTALKGLKLEPRKTVEVQSGERICFGKVEVTFLSAPSFLEMLARVAQA